MPSGHISCLPRNDDFLMPVICSKRSGCTQSINPPPFCITSMSSSIFCGKSFMVIIPYGFQVNCRKFCGSSLSKYCQSSYPWNEPINTSQAPSKLSSTIAANSLVSSSFKICKLTISSLNSGLPAS